MWLVSKCPVRSTSVDYIAICHDGSNFSKFLALMVTSYAPHPCRLSWAIGASLRSLHVNGACGDYVEARRRHCQVYRSGDVHVEQGRSHLPRMLCRHGE